MKDMPITEARDLLTSLPGKLGKSHETVSVTKRGKPVLAILSWDEYESIVETLEVLSDGVMMVSLKKGIKEYNQGKGMAWEDVKRKLDL